MFTKIITYLKESRQELKKVTWPTKEETKRGVLLVVVASLAVAFFLGFIDYLLSFALEKIIR